MKYNVRPFYLLLFILAVTVNFSGIATDFFSDDPGLYASIAKNLIYKKDLLQLYTYNQDWLDKPHFPFWMVYASFKVFGISVWAYKLPALLFFLLSLVYTFLFTRKYYTTETAIIAVLILSTAQHVILSNTDVRAEPYLMALIIGSIYHVARLYERFSISQLLLAALLAACAIMTKGIFVIVAIYGGLLGQLLFERKFWSVFSVKWLSLFVLTALFTLPELYALYIQFDMHPEKVVFGHTGVSGIRWFLWDSQFGRFVNNGPIQQKSSGDVFFFLHTLLWAFLPWCLLFYFSVYKTIKNIVRKVKLPEYYTISGGMLLLVLFSLSRFQLPFYTNIIFPLFAIITAPYCIKQLSQSEGKLRDLAQIIFITLLPLVIIVVHFYLKPESSVFFITDCIVFGALMLVIWFKTKQRPQRVFLLSCCSVLFANFYLSIVFFRTVAAYNGQIAAAKYVNKHMSKPFKIYSLRESNNVFQFYCNRPVSYLPVNELRTFSSLQPTVFFATQQIVDNLKQQHTDFKIIHAFINYPQENVLPAFINKNTRAGTLNHVYLISK
ncbi:ArnT family glycosyltransferase [Mucilaginibacter segetis]|uniref:Glycosyltransferase family 39 protein n=1 Tax=Mucilaginibacter segetis TaxID=2793071 RepID=A0A934UKW7_9SPHI|nr:glycosyltransferase family 39 protein [Mucilaginibacter segetis]MBK0377739.1 glycosyltransferase family 39 protein [Mucilaginibacter segetis]